MALQGTLETVALNDVLRLLASSSKTGRLRLSGDRGMGNVWLADGRVAAAEVDIADTHSDGEADALFHMLRFVTGSYVFEADEPAPHPIANPLPTDLVLADAEARLTEWEQITTVVPGPESWVTLHPDLDTDEVTIDAATWRRLVTIGSGQSIREMGDEIGEAELVTMRAVKELVERGLADVGEPPAPPAPPVVESVPVEPEADDVVDAIGEPDAAFEPVGPVESDPIDSFEPTFATPVDAEPLGDDHPWSGFSDLVEDEPVLPADAFAPVEPPVGGGDELPRRTRVADAELEAPIAPVVTWAADGLPADGDHQDPWRDLEEPAAVTPADELFADETAAAEPEDFSDLPPPPPPLAQAPSDEASDMARQLASLTPAAARAVAQAARATTVEEREEALAVAEAEDASIDRALLLRFLGSIDA